jgi:hypothetical protein
MLAQGSIDPHLLEREARVRMALRTSLERVLLNKVNRVLRCVRVVASNGFLVFQPFNDQRRERSRKDQ